MTDTRDWPPEAVAEVERLKAALRWQRRARAHLLEEVMRCHDALGLDWLNFTLANSRMVSGAKRISVEPADSEHSSIPESSVTTTSQDVPADCLKK